MDQFLNLVADDVLIDNDMTKAKKKDTNYNAMTPDGKSRFKKGNPGRKPGSKNKLSYHAAHRMEELGLDPLQGYIDVLEKARATGNLIVEERALAKLMQFRYAGLHHSMITTVDEKDLEVSVTKFEMPESMGKGGTKNERSAILDKDPDENENDSHPLGVNVTRFSSPRHTSRHTSPGSDEESTS
jgi:hypothetical protein